MKLAIVMCSYNRIAMTERSIEQLLVSVKKDSDIQCKIYVCDDGSTDGTPEILKGKFSNIVVLKGNGRLYWCKSMYIAMKEAVKENFDFYLMVNDDTDFKEDVIQIMMESYRQTGTSCGIVGSMYHQNQCTYGGRTKDRMLLCPNGKLQACYWANWNCFLIDRNVVAKVGIIDGKYEHAYGDYDYSYRMIAKGFPIYVATDYVGEAQQNSQVGTYTDNMLSRKKRLQLLFSPKGMPIYSYLRFHMRTSTTKELLKQIYGYLSIIWYILLKKEFKEKSK